MFNVKTNQGTLSPIAPATTEETIDVHTDSGRTVRKADTSAKGHADTGKAHMSVVITGHVDAGKSTTTGHLLYKLGQIDDRQKEKLEAQAKLYGHARSPFALLMDQQEEERSRGVTISCSTTEFFTDNYHYTIIDAPGHRGFIKNMMSGASQADIALLLLPATVGAFETAIARQDSKKQQMEGQTRQHAQILKFLGVDQVIVGVNKMDDVSVNYSEARFRQIETEVKNMLTQVGYRKKGLAEIPIIPMSANTGENLTEKSTQMPWYKGFEVAKNDKTIKGHTLLNALNLVAHPPERKLASPLRMPVSGVSKVRGVAGYIIVGRLEQGTLKENNNVTFSPSGAQGRVSSIEMHHNKITQAVHGDNVGINVKLKDNKVPHKGDVMRIDTEGAPVEVEKFQALVHVLNHSGQLRPSSKDRRCGYTPIAHVRTARVPCRLDNIEWKKGNSTGKLKLTGDDLKGVNYIEKGDVAEVTFTPAKPIFVTSFDDCPGLGRVAMMDSNRLVMMAKIQNVVYKKSKHSKSKSKE